MKTLQLLLLSLLLPALAFGQNLKRIDTTEMPKGVLGERIRAIITTLNAPTEANMRALMEKHMDEEFASIPFDEHLQVFQDTNFELGKVSFYSIRTYEPAREGQVFVILRDELGDWKAIVFTASAANDWKIEGMQFGQAGPPDGMGVVFATRGDLAADLAERFTLLSAAGRFSGAALYAHGDKVLYSNATGEASKSWHTPNRLDTKFNYGSMGKMFTAVAIMQLVEAGKLKLDDTIDKYLDEGWLAPAIAQQISVRHLLTHTSGLESYFTDAFMRTARETLVELEDYKALIYTDELPFEPGQEFLYSNSGFHLLGVIIEKVSGEDYYTYLQTHIFDVAGMTNTGCFNLTQPVENLAVGYSRSRQSPSGWENNVFKHVVKGGPAGGGYSTVEDFHAFAKALLAGTLVSKQSLDLMWTEHTPGYGFGFSVQELPEVGKIVGHGGGFPGISGNMDIFVDRGDIAVVLSNYDQGAQPVAFYLFSNLIAMHEQAK